MQNQYVTVLSCQQQGVAADGMKTVNNGIGQFIIFFQEYITTIG